VRATGRLVVGDPGQPEWPGDEIMSENNTTTVSNDSSFQAAIAAAPDDCTTRLIYADWLEEQGRTFDATCQRNTVAAQQLEAARQARETREKKYADARRGVALALGASFHHRIQSLYTSKRATVAYGPGGLQELDWDAYGKRGYVNPHTGRKQPAKWQNAGARIIGYARSGRVVVETSRGTEVARLPLPPVGADFSGNALVDGDLFALPHTIAGVWLAIRHGVTRTAGVATGYRRTGVAVRFPVPPDCREQGRSLWSVFRTTSDTYWEHGQTVSDCRAEYARKLALAEQERTTVRLLARLERAAHLVALLVPSLEVTAEDASAAGYCQAGIAGFAAKHGLIPGTPVTAAQLRQTGDPMVERPIRQAALRVARARFGIPA
jgi:uncharacterized protein (TIGR02996 family)